MIVVYLFLLFCMGICLLFKTKRYLHMLQQNLYNENNRYLKWVFRNYKALFDVDLVCLVLSFIGLFVVYDVDKFAILLIVILGFLYIFQAYLWKNRLEHDQNKKPLVITKRLRRLIVTTSILYFILVVLLFMSSYDAKMVWSYIVILSIMVFLNPFVVFIANIINYPIERCVYYYFKFKAQSKLNNMPDLKIIGITGSYGKTSSKNILSDILNIKYNALPTPRNLNTHNGLIMTINNDLSKFNDVFIAEMGAYVRGEIRELCELIHPKYGILTRLGTAHLETFGSEENIVKAKFELIESLPSDGFAVLNGDDPKQVSYQLKNKVRVIWIGIDNADVDVRAYHVKCSNKGMEFDVTFPNDKKKYHFETRLLGDHNVYNILAALAFGYEFGIPVELLQQAVKGVRPVEHRLQLKQISNFYQIDDAYNSNPVGAKNACKVLGMMPGMKIVVTPGMIELGSKEEEYNKEFGREIADVADYVILVGEHHTKPIKEGLILAGFDKDQILVLNDVRDAYPVISKFANDREVYALFENDLPDTYNE